MPFPHIVWIFLGIVALIMVVQLVFIGRLLNLFMHARMSGVEVGIFDLLGMQLRRTDPRRIVRSLIQARHNDVHIATHDLEKHVLAGGDPAKLVETMVLAKNHGVDLDFAWVSRCELAGEDPLAEVRGAIGAGPSAD